MINRFLSIVPALAFTLHVQVVQAQAPSQPPAPSKPQSQPPATSKPQPQAPDKAKPQQQPQGGGGFLYKSTMPDGRVIYGEVPEKGAVKVDKTRPDTSKKGITTVTPKEMAAAKRTESERTARTTGPEGDRLRMLEETLRKLEAARAKEKEPGERQRKLDGAIDLVRRELDKARAAK